MSLTINTAHSSKLSSKMLNDKIHELVGKNVKISGFTAAIKNTSSIAIAPGKCIILGAIIEESAETTLTPSLSGITNGPLFIYMVYDHENRRVTYSFSTTALTSAGALKLSTITVANGVMTSVANEAKYDIKLSDIAIKKADLISPEFTGTPSISSDEYNMLLLKRTSEYGTSIGFYNSTGMIGKLGFNTTNELIIDNGTSLNGSGKMLRLSSSGNASFGGTVEGHSYLYATNTDGGEAGVILNRTVSGNRSWKIMNNGGVLSFQHKTTSDSEWATALRIADGAGVLTISGITKGTFSGNLTGNVTGNASTATKLATARSIILGDALTGSISFDGSKDVTLNAQLARVDLTGTTTDLNTITNSDGGRSRRYIVLTTGGCANISNAPVKEPFILDVDVIRYGHATDYITKQTFTSATTKIVYERYCTNGTWSAWNTVYTTLNKPTASEVGALATAGGTMTGALNFVNNTWNNVGDDVAIGDCNQAGLLGIKGLNGNTGLVFVPRTTGTQQTMITDGAGVLTISGTTKGTFSGNLTGNVTGNASTATKLATARNIALTGAITGSATFDGSGNISITTNEGDVSFKQLGWVIETTDWNTLTTAGCYKVQISNWGSITTYHSPNAYSSSLYSYGLLLVFKSSVETENRTVQIYMPHRDENATKSIILTRMFNNGGWNAWSPIFKGVDKYFVGLENVTNESKATMFTNAALTGTPTAPTAAAGTNTTQIATTAFVRDMVTTELEKKMSVTDIVGTKNFDELVGYGFYDIRSATMNNAPIKCWGTLFVSNKGTTYQIFKPDYKQDIYYRCLSNGTWSSWANLISKSAVGLGNVDNTSDVNKPISAATQTALNGKLPLAGTTINNPNASNFSITNGVTGNIIFTNTGDTSGVAKGIGGINGANDGWAVRGYQTAQNKGILEISVGDDGDEGIVCRQYTAGNYKLPFMNNADSVANRSLTLMEPSTGNTIFYNNVKIPGKISLGGTYDPLISLALGDNDTGFNYVSDGIFDIYSDNVAVARVNKATAGITFNRVTTCVDNINFTTNSKGISQNGNLYLRSNGTATILSATNDIIYLRPKNSSNDTNQVTIDQNGVLDTSAKIRVQHKVDMQYNESTESLDFVFV